MRLLLSVASTVAMMPACCLAAEQVPPCGPEVKPTHYVAIDEYYPNPCWRTFCSVEVQFTVGTNGRTQDATVSDLESVPAEKRSCVEELVTKFAARAIVFGPQNGPCRYRMRVTYGRSDPDAA